MHVNRNSRGEGKHGICQRSSLCSKQHPPDQNILSGPVDSAKGHQNPLIVLKRPPTHHQPPQPTPSPLRSTHRPLSKKSPSQELSEPQPFKHDQRSLHAVSSDRVEAWPSACAATATRRSRWYPPPKVMTVGMAAARAHWNTASLRRCRPRRDRARRPSTSPASGSTPLWGGGGTGLPLSGQHGWCTAAGVQSNASTLCSQKCTYGTC